MKRIKSLFLLLTNIAHHSDGRQMLFKEIDKRMMNTFLCG
eukprot:UN16087